MEQQKSIAIIHRDRDIANLLATLAQESGHKASTMIVNKGTSPQDVASFVEGLSPLNLVLLAENYRDSTTTPEINPEYWRMIKQGEGIEALAEIRRRGVTAPVCMISSAPRHYERAMQEGANGYMPMTGGIEKLSEFLESSMR